MDRTARLDLELAVGELATNAVIHGAGAGTIRIWATKDQAVFEVHDDGCLTDPLAGRRPATLGEPHARGFLLVNQIAALVRVQADGDSGTTIRAYLDQRC